MTQEAYDVARAFRDGKRCSRKRTFTDGVTVIYQGSTIAGYDSGGALWVTLAGWPTLTTRDRLNAICDVFGYGRPFRQRNSEQFFNDVEIGSHECICLAGSLAMQAWRVEHGLHPVTYGRAACRVIVITS